MRFSLSRVIFMTTCLGREEKSVGKMGILDTT